MRVRERHLDRDVALRAADVDERLVLLPGELFAITGRQVRELAIVLLRLEADSIAGKEAICMRKGASQRHEVGDTPFASHVTRKVTNALLPGARTVPEGAAWDSP